MVGVVSTWDETTLTKTLQPGLGLSVLLLAPAGPGSSGRPPPLVDLESPVDTHCKSLLIVFIHRSTSTVQYL
eukprot:COSAG02_NODE_1519_length_12168_cov_5.127682_14_plen_72_part_00